MVTTTARVPAATAGNDEIKLMQANLARREAQIVHDGGQPVDCDRVVFRDA
jgi:hypothetical protein